MYWVNRKLLRATLTNPFNPLEKISTQKVNQIFTDIYNIYKEKHPNTWTSSSMPLNFFLDEFVKVTGADRGSLEKSIVDYIKRNSVIDTTQEIKKWSKLKRQIKKKNSTSPGKFFSH